MEGTLVRRVKYLHFNLAIQNSIASGSKPWVSIDMFEGRTIIFQGPLYLLDPNECSILCVHQVIVFLSIEVDQNGCGLTMSVNTWVNLIFNIFQIYDSHQSKNSCILAPLVEKTEGD